MWSKIWTPSNRKVLSLNIVSAFALNLFLEYMERKSFAALWSFIQDRSFVFLYNALIIFVTLSIVFLVKKKYFAYGIISAMWAVVGLANGIILNSRKTPFTAVDLTIAKSIIPVLNSYLSLFQIIGMIIALTLGIAALVVLFLYCPSAKKSFDAKVNAGLVFLLLVFFGVSTYLGVGRGLLISKFDNLIAGYQAYGVAYGFCITAIDTGIDRPIGYSRNSMKHLQARMEKALPEEQEEKHPNIIFIQLESFFDVTQIKNVTYSEDPLPNIHRIEEEYTSGYMTVPVYGAGTINTEFEMITGMNTAYFGTGEYPYRSILHKKACESMAYWLKEKGYNTSVIHNNNGSFYDRDYVFTNLGFDYFISSENMHIRNYNGAGWAKDEVLEDYIFEVLEGSEKQDYIYTISVQGHGDYPDDMLMEPRIWIDDPDWSQKYRNQMNYYANEIREMDAFIGRLTERLSQYPEDTVLVVYGDHLPGLSLENEELESGSKYKVRYFIWDNFDYNKKNKEEESENIRSYQLPAKVLGQMGIHNGKMNQYHQTMKETPDYKKNMKMLQYDLLYGSDFIREGLPKLEASRLKFCINNVRMRSIKRNEEHAFLIGANFTQYSRVYINGALVPANILSDAIIKVPRDAVNDGDEIIIRQVSKTNENVTYNESIPYKVRESWIEELTPNNP